MELIIARRLALTINPKKDLKEPHLDRQVRNRRSVRDFDRIRTMPAGRKLVAPPSKLRSNQPTGKPSRTSDKS